MSIELKQAAQQALEALETEQALRHGYSYLGGVRIVSTADKAIEALRTAIQQAESAEAQTKTGEPVHALLDNAHPLLVFAIESQMGVYQEHEIPTAARNAIKASKTYTNPAPGAPVGQAPSVWNSIQIASWIGSQLMREPSMFERNAVCKFVRSLGRHPTLLKHSPKDTHPAPGVPDWAACQRIAEAPEVDEALRLFAEGETTEDQAVAIVQAVLAASKAQKGGA